MVKENLGTGRVAVWVGMVALIALGWLYMVRMNAGVATMRAMGMPAATGLSALLATFGMWVVMMMAMMLPSIFPTVSLFAVLADRRNPAVATRMTAMFVTGYTLVWIAYCVPTAAAQWGLSRAELISAMGKSTSTAISVTILVAAGLFQFSPMKNACMSKCRSPLAFLLNEWRDGTVGALGVGMRNGSNCVACCWAVMTVLFVVGTMNLLWMALFTFLVVTEKIAPARWRLHWIVGTGFITWGVVTAIGLL